MFERQVKFRNFQVAKITSAIEIVRARRSCVCLGCACRHQAPTLVNAVSLGHRPPIFWCPLLSSARLVYLLSLSILLS